MTAVTDKIEELLDQASETDLDLVFVEVCEKVVSKARMEQAIELLCQSNRTAAEELAEWFDDLPEEEESDDEGG